ncbi:MAG: NTP transferase domain-containing protein, partial [Duncaniella sp.]|nr:NTP transferase domain-containing protein [Duncaniella sp.]
MHYGIIAAGEGSRLVSEGVALPKPLVKLNGVPMIKRLIDIFMESSPESLSIIVNEYMTEVRTFLESLHLPVPLNLVVKTTPSSMHSFYEVSKMIPDGKFCLTTVDTIFRAEDFRRYIDAFMAEDKADGYMAVTPFIDDEKPLYVA